MGIDNGLKEEYRELYTKADDEAKAMRRLYKIVSVLRKECPWDRSQTHLSLRKSMIEEAYEAVDAIEKNDMANLREELGDVTLQAVLNSIIAEEEGNFTMTDVINDECEKMIRRHPHVFSYDESKTVDKILERWENIKSAEHGRLDIAEELESVPMSFPALVRSTKIQKKIVKSIDADDIPNARSETEHCWDDFISLLDKGSNEDVREAMGKLLFSLVRIAGDLDIDPEEALRVWTDRYISEVIAEEL